MYWNRKNISKDIFTKDKKNNKVTIYKQEKENTLPVETRYFPLGNNGKRTLLKVELITGRAHQIRAHLASEGHSIVGDPKYGKNESNLKGQLLHSFCMEFRFLQEHFLIFPERPSQRRYRKSFSEH